jgi:recombination protein RecT
VAKNNAELSTKLAKSGSPDTTLSYENQLRVWYRENKRRLGNLLGGSQKADRLINLVVNLSTRNPKLMQCTFTSIAECIMQSAEVGLSPGLGGFAECSFVPFWNGKIKCMEAVFIPQYQGICKLAYLSGMVTEISGAVVYEADEFSFEYGTNGSLRHIPALNDSDRGERVCAWVMIRTKEGGAPFVVKDFRFINAIRDRSASAKYKAGPWFGTDDDQDAMALKTVLKQGLKTIPKQVGGALDMAIIQDNRIERPDLSKDVVVDYGLVGGTEIVSEQEVQMRPETKATKPTPSKKTQPQQKNIENKEAITIDLSGGGKTAQLVPTQSAKGSQKSASSSKSNN